MSMHRLRCHLTQQTHLVREQISHNHLETAKTGSVTLEKRQDVSKKPQRVNRQYMPSKFKHNNNMHKRVLF